MHSKKTVLENLGMVLGEFDGAPRPQMFLSQANFDDTYEDGKNFVYTVGPEDMKKLKAAYKLRKEDPQWLFHMFLDNDIKFPGFKIIADFVKEKIEVLTVFDEEDWTTYIVMILEAVSDEVFKMKLSLMPGLEEGDLPIPFDNFKKLFFALECEMPKILWKYDKSKEDRKNREQKTQRNGRIKGYAEKTANISKMIKQEAE